MSARCRAISGRVGPSRRSDDELARHAVAAAVGEVGERREVLRVRRLAGRLVEPRVSESDRAAEERRAEGLVVVGVGKLDPEPRLLDVDEARPSRDP